MPQAYIAAADPASRVTQVFTSVEALGAALAQGFIPIRQDGQSYVTQEFEGGILLDGAPLNVYYSGVWFPEQKELLAAHWGKDVPTPPANLLNLPTSQGADAQKALAEYHAWKESQTIAGIPKAWLVWGAIGVGVWYFFLRD